MFGGPPRAPGQTALVRHAPTLNGGVEGAVQQMTAENVTFNSNAFITGDLLVPGTPSVRLNGNAQYGGAIAGTGSATPTNYQVTLNGGARLGHLRTRTDPANLPPVAAPPQPTGSRSVSLNNSSQSPGDFSTLRNLTLNSNVGPVVVPPGTYGNFISNGNSRLILGVAGSSRPSIYHFQNLTLNSNSALEVIGPVIVTLNGGFSTNSPMGSAAHPEWFTLRIAGGGLSLNSNGSFHGYLEAPDGTLTLNSNAQFIGGVVCDRLIVNSNGVLRLVAATAANQLPTVALVSPAGGATFVFPAAMTLSATAGDSDGTVTKVEFYDGGTKLGEGRAASTSTYQLQLPGGLPVGSHVFTARVTDNLGATAVSGSVSITVTAPQNRLPGVAITAPASGSALVAGAPLNLSAKAIDADGTVARVDLYCDDKLVGTLTLLSGSASDYIFSGPASIQAGRHVLKVRAYDNTGASGDSAPLEITVIPRLPYLANFESTEGYQLGTLNGQLGWVVSQGLATVSRGVVFDGVQAVEMKPGTRGALITQAFAAPDAPAITFVDLLVHPAAVANPIEGSVFDLGGARIAFVRDGARGQLQARHAVSSAADIWKPAGASVAVDADGVATRWVRITARLNYQALTWDIYVDGQLVLFDLALGYAGTPPRGLTAFSVQGLASQPSHFDFLYAGDDNPLFADADHDGMDDAWELASGLDPTIDDRDGDRDGDGLSNIREYHVGTRADRADTDGDGMPDGWEMQHRLDPLVAGVQDADTDHDGVSDRQEFAAGTNPNVADTDGDGMPDGWEIAHGFSPLTGDSATDADGDGLSNFEEYRQGSDPRDFFNGASPRAEALNSGGAGPADELSMLVRKPDGTPWPNAPAVFQITSGTRQISASRNGPSYGGTVAVRADANGVARAYLEPYQP